MLNDEFNSFVIPSDASVDLQLHFSQSSRADFLSVVVPVYDDTDGLRVTIESLLIPTNDLGRFEIIVSNDGGDLAVSDLCRNYSVKEVIIKPNGGSYQARNRGIENSSGEFIALVDADQVVSPGWMQALRAALVDHDFVAGPVLLNSSPRPTPVEIYQMFFQPPADPKPFTHVPGALFFPTANIGLRRRVFEEMGGFDPRLRSAGDFEFSHRVTAARRYRQGYAPEMKVVHPFRNYRQIIRRDRRTQYGELSLKRLYPDRFNDSHFQRGLTWRLLFPDLRAFRKEVRDLNLGWPTYLKLFLLMWRIKLNRLVMLLSIKSRPANT